MLKQNDMLNRQSELNKQLAQIHEEGETKREGFLAEQARQGQQAYLEQINARTEAATKAQQAREDAEGERQQAALRASTRVSWQRAIQDHDAQENSLLAEISHAAQANLDIAGEPDPQKRSALMASDPIIQPMLDKYHQLSGPNGARDTINAQYALALHNLKDPDFKGVALAPIGAGTGSGTGAAADAPQFDTSGGGASTPNNPLDRQVPLYPSNSDADNTPAINRPTFPNAPPGGSPPGSSAAGMPPTVGIQRPPVTSMVGPLNPAPQLIPTPGMGTPPGGMFAGIGAPLGATPQLIPSQSY
jgi:hypothetical protein